ncbi:CRAL/TRIO domain-containing protein [Eremomyces bilateralis CBS 781.70]|uniref:CRAL/TRIO domain-containing protein n=1 Tax=Eremomyces bilateralis CBS 781.70 TaxID=1392243 RepID=A0A6G1GAW9_9PEZI|nr:CRAL/TRIO domain-containing protein [Eremomyces bilateralis CBS 781.70]KAF1815050.1 CRAL/TRIO domain-containing protein [Eremomyces bilateralis CBS 781.70]
MATAAVTEPEQLSSGVADLAIVEKPQEAGPPADHTTTSTGDKSTAAEEPAATKQEEEAAKEELPSLVKVLFPVPTPSSKPAPHHELTPEQTTKYEQILKVVSEWTEVPKSSGRNAPKEPITDEDRMFLTKECLLRYLRATKWNVTETPKRLLATLTWRREYGLPFTADYISPEMETGKEMIFGFDNEGRPCLHLNPGRQNTARSDRQLHALVYMLERVVDLMPPGQETLALLVNFKGTPPGGGSSVGQGREVLRILQGHYPERLGKALVNDLPWYITTFFKLVSPFIDPVTKTKMIFGPDIPAYIPKEQLPTDLKGDVAFEYDHAAYWPALTALCETRRKEQRERWETRGKKIGESEFYLRGGEDAQTEEVKEVKDVKDVKESESVTPQPETTAAKVEEGEAPKSEPMQ